VKGFVILLSILASPRQEENSIRPEYSTRRFNEVIDSYLKAEDITPQEQLISYRAKLVLAERRWNELKEVLPTENGQEPEKRDPTRLVMIKAAQAEMNHYQIKIAKLEEQILREKRKAREAALKAPKKKKKR
jgi:hypothetical protein